MAVETRGPIVVEHRIKLLHSNIIMDLNLAHNWSCVSYPSAENKLIKQELYQNKMN